MASPVFPNLASLGLNPIPKQGGISELGQTDWYEQMSRMIDEDRSARDQHSIQTLNPSVPLDRNRVDADRFMWDYFNGRPAAGSN